MHTQRERSMYTELRGLTIKVVADSMCDTTSTCAYTPTKNQQKQKPTQCIMFHTRLRRSICTCTCTYAFSLHFTFSSLSGHKVESKAFTNAHYTIKPTVYTHTGHNDITEVHLKYLSVAMELHIYCTCTYVPAS